MNYGFGTKLSITKDGKKVFFTGYEVEQAYFFNELSTQATFVAVKGLMEDSKAFEFYYSLKDCESNLFNKEGILLSHGGGYV